MPKHTQEMVLDAHDRAFAFFKGACTRGIYDNMKTAIDTIMVGRERAYNRRFQQMCSHYLVDPVACTPVSGSEKGKVENQAGPVRERTIWEQFEAERPRLVRYAGRFDGFHAVAASVSKTCLVRFDNNRYSVSAHAVGRPVEIRAYAEHIEIRQDRRVVGEHARSFGRDQTVYDPWHYVPVLARKPGALRNGAPFKDWVLPPGLERVRRKPAGTGDGDRQMACILAAVLSDGLTAADAACQAALRDGVHSADIVPNILSRHREPAPVMTIITPDALRLPHAPVADCTRYDSLRRAE